MTMRTFRNGRGAAVIAIVGALATGLVSLVLLLPFELDWRRVRPSPPSVRDISGHPADFHGRRVTLVGRVVRLVGQHGYTIEDPTPPDLLELLVLTPAPRGTGARDVGIAAVDDVVRVTGTLVPFDLADAEHRLGVDLEDARFVSWRGDPVLIVDDGAR